MTMTFVHGSIEIIHCVNVSSKLTRFHPAFSMTIDWDHQNATLHVINSLDTNFWYKNVRFPAVINWIYSETLQTE